MLKHMILILFLASIAFAQKAKQNVKSMDVYKSNKSTSEIKELSKSTLTTKPEYYSERYKKSYLPEIRFYNYLRPEENSFDIISSLQRNMNFGGIWDKYAVINFTPQLHLNPIESVSFYTNHYLNFLIPLDEIKTHTRTLVLQGFAIVVLDNSFKYLFGNQDSWVFDAVTYAAKNILLNILVKPAFTGSSDSPSNVLQFDNYYYSLSITF